MSEYTKKALEFATKHGITLTFIGDPEYKKHFLGDKECRYVFKCRLKRKGKTYTFNFGQSIIAGREKPDMYDILSCLTKCDPGSLENFCSEFGYDTDSIKANITYTAVCREWNGVQRLFGDILKEMLEIQ